MKPAAEFRDHQCAAAGIFSNQVALCHLEDAVQWLWVVTVTICKVEKLKAAEQVS